MLDKDEFFKLLKYFEVAQLGSNSADVPAADFNDFQVLTLGTKQATTSGTAFDFTGILAGVKRITISFAEVSLNGTDSFLVQLGDSGGFETSNYISTGLIVVGAGATVAGSATNGFIIATIGNAQTFSGQMRLTRMDSSHLWVASYAGKIDTARASSGGGSKTLSAELTKIKITRTGSNNFDNGSVNIMYE